MARSLTVLHTVASVSSTPRVLTNITKHTQIPKSHSCTISKFIPWMNIIYRSFKHALLPSTYLCQLCKDTNWYFALLQFPPDCFEQGSRPRERSPPLLQDTSADFWEVHLEATCKQRFHSTSHCTKLHRATSAIRKARNKLSCGERKCE